MKVVLTAPAFFPESFGGGEVYVHRVARELMRRGHSPTVLAAARWKDGLTGAYAITRYTYGDLAVVTVSMNPRAASAAELHTGMGSTIGTALREVLSELRPDLVHASGLKPAVTAACKELGIREVVTAHHAGIACPGGTLVRPDGAICNRRMTAAECVPCVNVLRRPRWYAGRVLGAVPRALYRRIGERLARRERLSYLERGLVYPWLVDRAVAAKRQVLEDAELVIAPSRAMHDLLVRNGRDPRSVVVIPHGVEPVGAPPLGTGRPVRLGYLGRIERLKGLHVLLDALEKLPGESFELHVFGAARNPWDEAYRAEAIARYRGHVPVAFHGLVSHDALASAFATFDVLVVPSILPEAFGLVVLEAFSAGRPVIVSRAGALPELVRDGHDGIVLDRCDGTALAGAIARVAQEPGLLAALAAGIGPVRTIEDHVNHLLSAYARVCAAGGARRAS